MGIGDVPVVFRVSYQHACLDVLRDRQKLLWFIEMKCAYRNGFQCVETMDDYSLEKF